MLVFIEASKPKPVVVSLKETAHVLVLSLVRKSASQRGFCELQNLLQNVLCISAVVEGTFKWLVDSCDVLGRNSPCAFVLHAWCARMQKKEALVSCRTFFRTFSAFQLLWKVHLRDLKTAVIWWQLGCHPYLVASFNRTFSRTFFLCKLQQNVLKNVLCVSAVLESAQRDL